MKETKEDKKKIQVGFVAYNPTESVIEDFRPTETYVSNQGYVKWGNSNDYPIKLYELWTHSTTLGACVQNLVNYVMGDEIQLDYPLFERVCNQDGETFSDVLRTFVEDLIIYGNAALNVLKNRFGMVCALYNVDIRSLRSNVGNKSFVYNPAFGKRHLGRYKSKQYPKFNKNINEPSSIFFVKLNGRHDTYGSPLYRQAIAAAELEVQMSRYSLSEITTNLQSSVIINMNAGYCSTDEQKEEVEGLIYDKFCNTDSLGPLIIYNPDKDHETTVTTLDNTQAVEKYAKMEGRVRNQLFMAFRCSPEVIGVDENSKGFQRQSFDTAAQLFQTSVVAPIQKLLCSEISKLLGKDDVLHIKTFTIFNDDMSESTSDIINSDQETNKKDLLNEEEEV